MFIHGAGTLRPPFFRYFFVDGVGIFFALSGFLIGGILVKIIDTNDGLSFTQLLNFWKRRWYRTLPNYFLVLTVAAILTIISRDESVCVSSNDITCCLSDIASYYFFLQNFSTPPPSFFRESWSLSVEEWFYLLIPALVFILSLSRRISARHALLTVCVTVVVASVGLRWNQFLNKELDSLTYPLYIHWQVIRRLDSIVVGVIGAYVYYYYPMFWVRIKNIAFVIGLVTLLVYHWTYVINDNHPLDLFFCVFSTLIFGIAVLFTLPFLSQVKSGSGPIFKFITYTSLISYSMYLLNQTIISHNILKWIPLGPGLTASVIKYGLYWVLTFVLSIVLYKYYEKPMMNLRDRSNRKQSRQREHLL